MVSKQIIYFFFIHVNYITGGIKHSSSLHVCVQGIPQKVGVVSLDPPDFRGEEVYRIQFTLLNTEQKIVDGFTHRSVWTL